MMALDFIDVFYGGQEFDNFGAKLFQLIMKADHENMERLRMAFPLHVALHQWYMQQERMPTKDQIVWKAKLLEDGDRSEQAGEKS